MKDTGKITVVIVNVFDHFIYWAKPRKISREKSTGKFKDEHGEEYIVLSLGRGQRVFDDLRGLRVDDIEDISFWCNCHTVDIDKVRDYVKSRLRKFGS